VKIEKRSNTVTGFRVMLRFILDQQNSQYLFLQPLLVDSQRQELRDLFSYGAVSLRAGKASNGVYRYQVNSFKGLIPIRNYFLIFPLKSKKLLSFKKWNEIYKMVLNKEHLLEKGLTSIRELSKNININNSLNRKTGSAKPK
jgi:LAGLIDADG DNA endonuclease family protein